MGTATRGGSAKMIKARVRQEAGSFDHGTGTAGAPEMTSTSIFYLLIAYGIVCLASSQNRDIVRKNQSDYGYTKQSSASCPERNGRFPVPNQCDAYIECIDGVPEEKLCPEGLLFNPEARFNYPCGYPIDVDCDGRPNRQPPQPTDDCPHQYGYFKVGDRENCGQFMNCVEGRGYLFDCPVGLAFNSESYRCDWPDQVSECDAEAFLGFKCPEDLMRPDRKYEIRFFRSAMDCRRYYVCVDGRPRLQDCGEGRAFNDLIETCDAAENVTGCETSGLPNEDSNFVTEL